MVMFHQCLIQTYSKNIHTWPLVRNENELLGNNFGLDIVILEAAKIYKHVPIWARGVILPYNEYKHEVWYVISRDKLEII